MVCCDIFFFRFNDVFLRQIEFTCAHMSIDEVLEILITDTGQFAVRPHPKRSQQSLIDPFTDFLAGGSKNDGNLGNREEVEFGGQVWEQS